MNKKAKVSDYISVLDALKWASSFVDSAVDSRMILAHVMGLDDGRVGLAMISERDTMISNGEFRLFQKYIKQRSNGRPVAKILGKKDFWKGSFLVDDSTLDPRPDSESIIEEIISLPLEKEKEYKFCDLGTGSGCLLLSVLDEFPNSAGLGVDINSATIDMARKNLENSDIKNKSRVKFMISNWNDEIKSEEKFDIVISNPPYIPSADIDKLDVDVKNFDPLLALDGGSDGLDPYRYILQNIHKNIHSKSYIVFEIGKGQKNDIVNIAKENGYRLYNYRKDLAGVIRCLVFVADVSN